MQFHPLLRASLALTLLLTLSGCGDDTEEYTLSLRTSEQTLPNDNSRTARLTVTLLKGERAAEFGSTVRLLCVDSEGSSSAYLNGNRQPITLMTDEQGTATAIVACGAANDVSLLCRASYQNQTASVGIQCVGRGG